MKKMFKMIIIIFCMSTLIYGEAESKKSLDSNIDNVKNQNPKKKKLVKISEEQDRYYRNSEKYLKEGRFGSEYVGFIGLPDWKEMKWLIDIYSESYTLEISKDGVDIYTLDSFDINDKKGLSDEWLAKTLAEQEFRKYLNEGYKRNSLEIKKIESSGYKGMQIKIKETSGKIIIKNIFVIGNKVYHANAEGLSKNINEMEKIIQKGNIPVLVDEEGKYIEKLNPFILIDSILAKKNLGTRINMAPITIGVGPGFYAGKDVHAVIETKRGHHLGKVIYHGEAIKNSGIPGNICGFTKERVIHSLWEGNIENISEIGNKVKKGQVIAKINNNEILATIDGILRGIIREGYFVTKGFKIADIDPRIDEYENCFTISDKARSVGGGVLEAILTLKNKIIGGNNG